MATILIVDDRPTNREFLVTLLGYGGHRLLEATDGAEGLAAVHSERPDLVIADILMPTMDGYEFVRQLRNDPALANTRVVFFTAHYHEPEARRLAAACGVTEILTKPCDPEVVLRTVEAALGRVPAPIPAPVPTVEQFDREHLTLLTDKLSQQADEARRTSERMTALVELGLLLGSERDPGRLLHVFCDSSREIVGARYALVGIPNGEDSYRHFMTSGMDLATVARVGRPGPLGGVLGSVLAAGRCFRSGNHGGLEAAGVPPSFPRAQALLAAPVVSPSRVYGWVCLLDKVGGDVFTDEDERFARMLAAQVGRVYENGSLYNDLLRHSSKLAEEIAERERSEAALRESITDRLRAEEDLRRTADLLRAVAEGTTDSVFVKDRDGKYLFFNEAASRFVGRPITETLGKDDTELFDPAGARQVMARDRQVMASGLTETAEETLTSAGVTRTFLATKGPYRDASGGVIGVIGISHDITNRIQAERRLATQFAVVSILAGAADLPSVAPKLLRVVCETLGWDLGDLWVVDRQARALSCVSVWHADSVDVTEFLELTRRTTFVHGVGLPGRVWAARQPIWVVDVTTDPAFIRADAAAGARLRGAFAFPVLFGDEVLGVAEFFCRDSRPPDDELFRTFESLGSQIGQFIERKRAEEVLRLFRTLIDRATDAIEVVDPETGRFLDMNERACEAHGYTRDEYLQLKVTDVDPVVASRPWHEIMAGLQANEFRPFESIHQRKDGSTFPVEINLSLIRLDREYLVAVLRDITDRKRAEEDLRLRDRAMRAVSQGILIADANQPDNPLVYVSPGFEKITGYSADEAIGRNCRFLQAPDTDPVALSELRAAIQNGEPCQVELRNLRKDGLPFWNELSLSPVRDDTGRLTHFVGVQTDVTARRILEDQFRQSQKMEAVGRLAGGVAHDFNNLLTIINGYGELVLGGLPASDPNRDLIREMVRAGERAANLTRQLLAFSRKSIIEPKLLDLKAVVAEVERMLHRVVGEDVLLAVAADPEVGPVRADRGQLEQVLMNLVVNARDAMPIGGRLTLEVRNAQVDESYTRTHPDARPGPYVLLAVTDTGCGMDAATVTRIFEPFFSTKGEHGTGLGLATVHGIVKQAGGHVAVYSEVGIGTAFKVYLPLANKPKPVPVARPERLAMPRGGETVLLVEDEDGVRALSRHILRNCGYTVVEARDGLEAVRLAGEHRGQIDLLVTDVVMPRMGGREVAHRIAELHPIAMVLFLSGYTDDAIVRHGILEAEVAFLQKPFTPASLAAKVREVLDTRTTGES